MTQQPSGPGAGHQESGAEWVGSSSPHRPEPEPQDRPAGPPKPAWIILVVLAAVSLAWGYTGYQNPDLDVGPELQEEWLRGAMYDAIISIEASYDALGQPPATLEEAGLLPVMVEGFQYSPSGDGSYTLTAEAEGISITYARGDDLSRFAEDAGAGR